MQFGSLFHPNERSVLVRVRNVTSLLMWLSILVNRFPFKCLCFFSLVMHVRYFLGFLGRFCGNREYDSYLYII